MGFQVKPFIRGNVLLIVCCAFYLAWWLIAFKPEGAVKGFKSGWLLLPAAVCGIAGVVQIVPGIWEADLSQARFDTMQICIGGIVTYFLLLAGSWFLLKRPVTTELVLIVGWVVLTFAEINALFAEQVLGKGLSFGLCAATLILAVISLICYLAYYNLDAVKGYYDGAVPLVLVAVMSAVLLILLR